jgi:nitrite reductase/ring-hydroxylating ferredoxin subunit
MVREAFGGKLTPQWVANSLSRDLLAGGVMRGVCAGQEVAIWRSAAGHVSAWNDRCPHRGMRLSHGFVRGETLSCIYHGWVYSTNGGCRRIPAHPDLVPPAAIRTEVFACADADGVIWVALPGTTSAVPALPDLRPLRSLTFCTVAARLAQAVPELTGADRLTGRVSVNGHGVDLCLLLQDAGDGLTTVHALCAPQADGVAVSRWLESLRRRVEAGVAA